MYPSQAIFLSLLASLARPTSSAPTASSATVNQEQLFQLVVRVVKQPDGRSPYPIEGYRVASQDFITNSREIILIPKTGVNTSDENITPDTFYVNSSSVTVRQAKTEAEVEKPYGVWLEPLFASPLAYVAQILNYDVSSVGTYVYSHVDGQPYFGNLPPNNYNVSDPGEGHYLACDFDEDGDVGPLIYSANGLSASSDGSGDDNDDCAEIRLLPECQGNFSGGSIPENVELSSCYVDAETAPLPTLPN